MERVDVLSIHDIRQQIHEILSLEDAHVIRIQGRIQDNLASRSLKDLGIHPILMHTNETYYDTVWFGMSGEDCSVATLALSDHILRVVRADHYFNGVPGKPTDFTSEYSPEENTMGVLLWTE